MTKERIILLCQFAVIGIASLTISNYYDSNFITQQENDIEQTSPANIRGSDLQVKQSVGDPVPLNTPLQGAKGSSQQKASGSLQTPSEASDLQPNAKLPDFPSEL